MWPIILMVLTSSVFAHLDPNIILTDAQNALCPQENRGIQLGKSCLVEVCKDEGVSVATYDEMVEGLASESPFSAQQNKIQNDYTSLLSNRVSAIENVWKSKTRNEWIKELDRPDTCHKTVKAMENLGFFTVLGLSPTVSNEFSFHEDRSLYRASFGIVNSLVSQIRSNPLLGVGSYIYKLSDEKQQITQYFSNQLSGKPSQVVNRVRQLLRNMNQTKSSEELMESMKELDQVAGINPLPKFSCQGLGENFGRLLDHLEISTNVTTAKVQEELSDPTPDVTCRVSEWARNSATYTEAELAAFKSNTRTLIKNFHEKLFSRLSEGTKRYFESVNLEDIIHVMPNPGTLPETKIMSDPALRSNLGATSSGSPGLADFVTVANAVKNLNVNRSCSMHTNHSNRAHWIPVAGSGARLTAVSIHVAPLAVKRNQMGVLAHEIGHWIAGRFSIADLIGISPESATRFKNFRRCITGTESRSSETYFEGDSFWTEEDSGDVIASIVTPDWTKNNCLVGSTPLTRLVGSESHDRHNFELTTRPEDPHSPLLLRLLNARMLSGKSIPQVCQDALKEQGVALGPNCVGELLE